MSLRLYGTISGGGRSAGAVIPALGSGRYSPGPNIVWPSWRKGSDPHFTLTVFWGQPGALATVSVLLVFAHSVGLSGKWIVSYGEGRSVLDLALIHEK